MIRKTRLLAGFMTAVLLSTTCLGGVSAAGEEGITTLNASASEDESATWKATVTAGETLFPEGTELTFAVADEEKKAAVQEQLLAEIAEENAEEDTTAEKTLQDLHVYDFSLTDAQGAAVEYTDKVTYSVKSDSAADTDTDAADYVIYRVIENEDSGEGVAVTLEPIENSTGTVKLDESGWMTEFSVETEPVERIAVAVYKTAVAEKDENPEAGDRTEEKESAEDVGVSTFAAVNKNNLNGYVIGTEKVKKDSYAPMNNLMILDNIPDASVEVIDWDKTGGVATDDPTTDPDDPYSGYQIKIIDATKEYDGKEDSVDAALSQGDFLNSDRNDGIGPGNSMYKDMRGDAGDLYYGGIAVMFKGSDPNAQCEPDESYQWTYDVGWDDLDQSIEDTSMWVELLYTNAGYYKGELVNAVAKISVTPSKNRNPSSRYNSNGYAGVYNPMIQVSGSLYRGWVWQNVEQFHVDLSFYYADEEIRDENKILIGAENSNDMNYNSMFADYYTINSLNPIEDTTSWESPPRYIGPEYVLPTQEITHAYIVDTFEVEEVDYTSNIRKEYVTNNSGTEGDTYTQVAYNGGTNEWGGAGVDEIDAPRFAQNSVMIIPKQTPTLSFTMGKMERKPWYNGGEGRNNLTQATNMMWATISTRPFTQTRVPVNINFTKNWGNMTETELNKVLSVDFELWLESENNPPEKLRKITITKNENNEWKGTFELVPDLKFYIDHGYNNPKYVLKEIKVNYTDKTSDSVDGQDFPYDISGNLTIDNVTRKDGDNSSYEINQEFSITNTKKQKGSVTVIKKGIDGTSEMKLDGVEFQLQRATVEGDVWNIDSSSSPITKTTVNGQCEFKDLEKGNYLLTETKTLSGYTLLKEPVKITIPYIMSTSDVSGGTGPGTGTGIQDGDKTYYYNLTYTITNGQSFDLPQTGETSADRIMRTGMILFVTAGGALLYLNRKRRREQQKS